MKDNKVLLISQVFYPDEVAVANLFTNLCSYLVKSEMEIKVWCSHPSYTTRERQPRHRIYQGIEIHYLTSTNFGKDKMVGRFLNYFTFSASVIFRLIFSRDKFRILSHTTPPFLSIVIAWICKLKNRRFVYVLMDVFPDGLIRLGKANPGSIFIKMWKSLHLNALKRCEKIIVIGRDMREWLCSICPDAADKVEYIPLWQDSELIRPVCFRENPFAVKNNLLDHFVVQYSGNMGLWNDMKSLGHAVRKTPEDILYLFIGGGMRKNELVESIGSPLPDNVRFLSFRSNEDYSLSVTACHVALVSLRDGLEGMAVPSKIIGIMAAGVPVIAMVPGNSEIAFIVNEEKCGIVLNPGDSDGLVETLLKLKNDDVTRTLMGQNGRRAFEEKYTTEKIASKYRSILVN